MCTLLSESEGSRWVFPENASSRRRTLVQETSIGTLLNTSSSTTNSPRDLIPVEVAEVTSTPDATDATSPVSVIDFSTVLQLKTPQSNVLNYDSIENLGASCFPRDTCKGATDGKSRLLPSHLDNSCFCDQICSIYNDCCVDSPFSTNGSIPSSSLASSWTCVNTRLGSFYFKSTCPSNVDYISDQTRVSCESPPPESDPMRSIPVTAGSFTYKNAFCAQCNGVPSHEWVYWHTRLQVVKPNGDQQYQTERSQADQETSDQSTTNVTNVLGNMSQQYIINHLTFAEDVKKWALSVPDTVDATVYFEFIVSPPEFVTTALRPCVPSVIKSCPDDYHNANTIDACKAYQAIIYHKNGNAYRNAHCALCHSLNTFNDLKCYSKRERTDLLNSEKNGRGSSSGDGDADEDSFLSTTTSSSSFSILFDISAIQTNVISSHDTISTSGSRTPCNLKYEMYDPFRKKCRNLLCGSPDTEVKNGTCVPIHPVTVATTTEATTVATAESTVAPASSTTWLPNNVTSRVNEEQLKTSVTCMPVDTNASVSDNCTSKSIEMSSVGESASLPNTVNGTQGSLEIFKSHLTTPASSPDLERTGETSTINSIDALANTQSMMDTNDTLHSQETIKQTGDTLSGGVNTLQVASREQHSNSSGELSSLGEVAFSSTPPVTEEITGQTATTAAAERTIDSFTSTIDSSITNSPLLKSILSGEAAVSSIHNDHEVTTFTPLESSSLSPDQSNQHNNTSESSSSSSSSSSTTNSQSSSKVSENNKATFTSESTSTLSSEEEKSPPTTLDPMREAIREEEINLLNEKIAEKLNNLSSNFINCNKINIDIEKSNYFVNDNGSFYLLPYKRILSSKEFVVMNENETALNLAVCSTWLTEASQGMHNQSDEETMNGQSHSSASVINSTVQGYINILESTLTQFGLTISIICLLLHLITFTLLPEMQNLSGKNLASLAVYLLIGYTCFIGRQIAPHWLQQPVSCRIIAFIMYHTFISAFIWSGILSFDVWRSLRLASIELRLNTGSQRVRFIIYSIVSIFISTTFTLIVIMKSTSPEILAFLPAVEFQLNKCWFTTPSSLVVYFILPVAIVLLLNIGFFTSISLLLTSAAKVTSATFSKAPAAAKKRKTEAKSRSPVMSNNSPSKPLTSSTTHSIQNDSKLYFKLSILMGLTWILGIIGFIVPNTLISLLFILLNTTQGLFIFCSFTLTEKVKKGLSDLLGKSSLVKSFGQRLTVIGHTSTASNLSASNEVKQHHHHHHPAV